jgi:hypothetical protein
VSRWLVGVVGLGAEICSSAHTRRAGRFFNSSAEEQRAVPRPPGPGPEGLAGTGGEKPLLFTTHSLVKCPRELLSRAWPGWRTYVPSSRRGQGEQNNGFATIHSQALSDVQEENHSCTRDT